MLNGFMKFASGKWSNVNVSEVNPLPVNIVNDNSPVSSSNPLLVQSANATPTNRSGSITTGGAAQVAMAALSTRKGYFFQNISSEIMWGSWVGTAAPSTAGSFLISPNGIIRNTTPCETTALSIYGATTGQKYTMWEM